MRPGQRVYEWFEGVVFAAMLCMMLVTSCVSCGGAVARAVLAPHGMVPDAVLDERMAATVAITVGCTPRLFPPARVGWAGSGVAMGDRYVLTAAHVVPYACLYPGMIATFPDSTKYEMRVDAVLVDEDLARLVLVNPKESFPRSFPVKVATARPGDHVCLTPGNPARGISCGRIKARTFGPKGRTADLLYDAPTIRGNSGSGLFNADGALVGIVVQWWKAEDGKTSLGGKATSIGGFGRRWIASTP